MTDAANSVPPGKQRDIVLMQIANRGLAELSEVVQQSNSNSAAIGESLRRLRPEFDAIRFSQKFGNEERTDDERQSLEGDDQQSEGDKPDKTDMSSGDVQNLERPDDPSLMIPAATSVGDPFKAERVSVTVPGVGSVTRNTIEGMTAEAAQLRGEATQIAGWEKVNTSVATIAWVGYQPPLNMDQFSVLDDDLAQAGAPKLTSFLHDLDTASHNPNQTPALFGHSCGSLTSGIALQDGASAYVDNAVLYGSPGFQADTPAELGMNDNNFFVMAATDDLWG